MNFSTIEGDCQDLLKAVSLEPLAGKSIIVTGASGLLGQYFLMSLLQSKIPCRVYAIIHSEADRLWMNYFCSRGIVVVRGDLSDRAFLESLPTADFVVHCAGYGQPGKFLKDPVKTIEINTTATGGLFRKLSSEGKLLFLSTSELYVGSHLQFPHEETIGITNTNAPRACYIEAKRCGEAICHAFHKQGIEVKIARLALGFGPGTKRGDPRVLHSFIERAITERQIKLMDHGSAKRTYCYVLDVMEMLWNISLYGKETVYNVGGESRTTIGELAQMIGSIAQVPVLFPEGLPKLEAHLKGAPQDVHIDISRYKNEFQKNSFVSLATGLTRTYAWQESLMRPTLSEAKSESL